MLHANKWFRWRFLSVSIWWLDGLLWPTLTCLPGDGYLYSTHFRKYRETGHNTDMEGQYQHRFTKILKQVKYINFDAYTYLHVHTQLKGSLQFSFHQILLLDIGWSKPHGPEHETTWLWSKLRPTQPLKILSKSSQLNIIWNCIKKTFKMFCKW